MVTSSIDGPTHNTLPTMSSSDSDSDALLTRSISAPDPDEHTYMDANATDPAWISEPTTPSLGPTSLVPNILTQLSFSLDSFIAQNLEEELTDLPVLANQIYKTLRQDLKKNRQKLKHQMKHQMGSTKRQFDKQRGHLKSQIDTSLAVWEKNMQKASVVRFMDKVAFTLGMFECCCTPWLVAQYPEWIPLVHTVQVATLIVVRYFLYKKKSWHFFLLDMCYFVSIQQKHFICAKLVCGLIMSKMYCDRETYHMKWSSVI